MRIDEVVYEQAEDAPKGWAVDMSIDEGAFAHIIGVLTDLYKNRILAVIREYSTNASDAHVDAGIGKYAGAKQRPIQVTLPTREDPNFRVRDFGLGLTYNDIEIMYSRYGASTKRDSNAVNGMLGLGCKAALTYTDAFSLRGIVDQDGVHVESKVEVRRTKNGGTMTVLGEEFTEEETGTEIIVPVKLDDIHEFAVEARDFYRFWESGTVLVDGAEPTRLDGGIELAPNIIVSREVDEHTIVMGGVPYPVETGFHVPNLGYGYKVVAWVNIGEVNFVPSREALGETPKTEATVAAINSAARNLFKPALTKLVDAAPNHHEALAVAQRLYGVGLREPVYKGEKIPSHIARAEGYPPQENFIPLGLVSNGGRGWRASTISQTSLEPNATIWLDGSDEKKGLTPYKREKLSIWRLAKGIHNSRFVLVDKLAADEKKWIDPKMIHDYAEVKATKVIREKVERNDGRVSGSYEAWVTGTYCDELKAQDIDTSHPIFYVLKSGSSPQLNILNTIHSSGYTVVRLGKNRVNKFLRDFPQSKALPGYVKEQAAAWASKLTANDHRLIALAERGTTSAVLKLDETRINDPKLKQRLIEVKGLTNSKLIKDHGMWEHWVDVPEVELDEPLDAYPLVSGLFTGYYATPSKDQVEHAYHYMNYMYSLTSQPQAEALAADFFTRVGFTV